MKETKKENVIKHVRIAYWAGAILDFVAFLQMILPRVSARLMGGTVVPDEAYVFAMRLGAGLMLAWTVLLIWADRKPLERADILPITMIVLLINVPAMLLALQAGLLPFSSLLPQLGMAVVLLFWYGGSYLQVLHLRKTQDN